MPRGVMPRQPARTGRHEGAGVPRRSLRQAQSVRQGQDKLVQQEGRFSPAKNVGEPFSRSQEANFRMLNSASQSKLKLKGKDAGKISAAAKARNKAASVKRGYDPIAPERVAKILQQLDQLYPDATCALTHKSAWELLVATILSAQSTDVNVNRVTPELFRKYPTVEAFAALEPEQLQPDIRSTGFFRNKSKSVVGAAKKVVADFGGQVPLNMKDLLTLPGVARKTANVVLGTWFKIADGVVVDTHVTRISRRLELTAQTDPQKIEQDLMRIIPREKWILFAHQMIWHGRKLCYARKPKCADCALENICHAADKTWSTVEIHKSAKV